MIYDIRQTSGWSHYWMWKLCGNFKLVDWQKNLCSTDLHNLYKQEVKSSQLTNTGDKVHQFDTFTEDKLRQIQRNITGDNTFKLASVKKKTNTNKTNTNTKTYDWWQSIPSSLPRWRRSHRAYHRHNLGSQIRSSEQKYQKCVGLVKIKIPKRIDHKDL